MDNTTNKKAWFKRPENFTGLAILAGLGYGFFTFLPTLILLAQNTLYFGFLVGALGLGVFAVLDKNVRTTAFYAWKMFTRKLTGILIELDPIAIVQTYLQKMRDNLAKMSDSIAGLKGQKATLGRKIKDNDDKVIKNANLAEAAKKKNDMMSTQAFMSIAAAVKTSNQSLKDTAAKIDLMLSVLTKMYDNTKFILDDTTNKVSIKIEERKAIEEAHRAMQSGFKIIRGDSEQKLMFDQAMESIADTMGRQLGEMERIMDMSSNMMNAVDYEKGVVNDNALKMLDQWEKEGNSVLLGTDKNVLISQAYDSNQVVNGSTVAEKVSVGNKKDRFSKLLN